MPMISVSIVTFHPDLGVLKKLLEALEKAVAALAALTQRSRLLRVGWLTAAVMQQRSGALAIC